MNIIKKYLKIIAFFNLILICNISYIPKALSALDLEQLEHLDPNDAKPFAQHLFGLGLAADEIAITELYFKNNPEGAAKVLLQAQKLYEAASKLDPMHPNAHIFDLAHDHLDGDNKLVEGNKDAQKAVSGLYADGIEQDVPDNVQIQAYWLMKASQQPGAPAEKAKTMTWIDWAANKVVTGITATAAGAVAGYTVGVTISQQTGQPYWVYVGIGVGAGGGFVTWICGLNFYNIYDWWTNHRNAKRALKDINDAVFDDAHSNIEDYPKIISIRDQDDPDKEVRDLEAGKGANIDQNHGDVEIEVSNPPSKSAKRRQKKARSRFKEFLKKEGPGHDVVLRYLERTKKERIDHKNMFKENNPNLYAVRSVGMSGDHVEIIEDE